MNGEDCAHPITTAWIGLGANIGQPWEAIETALAALDALPETRLTARSSLYRSAPIDAPGQPDFYNAVARIETALTPSSLLRELESIEHAHGRERSFQNAPRTLDLDLLLYGDAAIALPDLVVPHPRMHLRAFVLVPLAEIEPQLEIPGVGTLVELLPTVADQAIERLP
ncbi:MAG: 2-amino-4-hydroxy-6-hydroxymethyldihydropteridine diphosphokinase [Betaproteobacteria bacterium]|nr:2-amino-4-hydroxy-6-hydroxymethyldihydropteridine diphosphokinase [Betaproteobacteria bacterium]